MFYQKYKIQNFVELFIVENNNKIVFVGNSLSPLKNFELIEKETDLIKTVKTQIDEYLNNKRQTFDFETDFVYGTEFQKSVWHEISKIPYGKTLSYSDITKNLNTKGVRAVGTACGKNPLTIIVPCHRVIQSSGKIGNYAFGEKYKNYLLNLEK